CCNARGRDGGVCQELAAAMTLPAYSSSLPMTLLLAGFTRCTRWQAKQATLSYSSGSALSFSVPALDMSTNQTAPSLEFDRLTTNATPLSNVRRTMTMHKLATGGLLPQYRASRGSP